MFGVGLFIAPRLTHCENLDLLMRGDFKQYFFLSVRNVLRD